MQMIRFIVDGSVPRTAMEALAEMPGIRVTSQQPLELAVEDSLSFKSVDGAVRGLGVAVTHVYLRREAEAVRQLAMI